MQAGKCFENYAVGLKSVNISGINLSGNAGKAVRAPCRIHIITSSPESRYSYFMTVLIYSLSSFMLYGFWMKCSPSHSPSIGNTSEE